MKKTTISLETEQAIQERGGGIVLLSLHRGMQISIQGKNSVFEVIEWEDYRGSSTETTELRVTLRELPKTKWKKMPYVQI